MKLIYKFYAASLLSVLWCSHAQAQAVSAMPPTETDGQSIELGNLNDPEEGTPTAAPVAGEENPTASGGANAAASPAPAENSGVSDVGANVPKPATQTPMELYRDLKLQQASRPNSVNPASVRRYLKVDRATLMDAANSQ